MKKILVAAALVASLSAVAVACDDGDDATPEPTTEPTPVVAVAPQITEAPAEETLAPEESPAAQVRNERRRAAQVT